MENACKKTRRSGWVWRGTPTIDKGQWVIPFRSGEWDLQAFVRDREIATAEDETALVDEIEKAVGLASRVLKNSL